MSHSEYRHALVTGGAGFIGSHLTRALLDRGMGVTVLDDLSVGTRDRLPSGVRFVEGDVRDTQAVDTALEGVDCVFHEAAIVSVRTSVVSFRLDADVNLSGTLTLLERMNGSAVRKAFFASSMAVYADSASPTPVSESHPTAPLSPYGIAKLAAEKYWHMLCGEMGIESTVLRYFNTYGPGQTLTPYVGVITIFINRLLAGEPVTIFGDGEQRRDFVHVDDIVRANLCALDGNASGSTFNVGTGNGTSVNQIGAALIEMLAPELRAIHAPAEKGEMRNSIADISRIRNRFGFEPERSELAFEDVIRYWQKSDPEQADQ